MKLRQESRVLKRKALASLTHAVEAFNSPTDEGRVTRVLLCLQHAFEMLIKAALTQGGTKLFDRQTGRSIGFERCLGLASADAIVKLTESEAGTLRAVDAMRDDEQHWFNHVPEQFLYLHAKAAITLFDDLLKRVFKESLAKHLPVRVLPLSIDPPRELTLLLDEEYSQIASLLKPGRRAGHEARARIRTLLAMEAHVEQDVRVSNKDVDRVESRIRSGDPRDRVFPRLEKVTTIFQRTGVDVKVHFTKKEGAPVQYVADETAPAGAIREVDLQRKFHRTPTELAKALGLTTSRTLALRRHLGIDTDESCMHQFVFGAQRHNQYSDNAFTKMREALNALDMNAVWKAHQPRKASIPQPRCEVPGCQIS